MLNSFSNSSAFNNVFTSAFRKLIGKKTKLQGVNGYTGRGEFEHYTWKNDNRRVDICLRGVAGKVAEIYFNDCKITDVTVKDGTAKEAFNLPARMIRENSTGILEVRQNNQPILSGAITHDK